MRQAEMKPLKRVKMCAKCRGSGQVWGAVQHIICHNCLGARFQSAGDDKPATIEELGAELHETRIALAVVVDRLNAAPLSTGPDAAYYGNNGRGAGGSNFTGD